MYIPPTTWICAYDVVMDWFTVSLAGYIQRITQKWPKQLVRIKEVELCQEKVQGERSPRCGPLMVGVP